LLSKPKTQSQKQDQCGILAQILLLCGNLSTEIFFAERYSALSSIMLSSAAMVTVARTVQHVRFRSGWLNSLTEILVASEIWVGGKLRSHSSFVSNAAADLYFWFALTPSNKSGAAIFHAQTHVPTESAQAIEEARVSHAHEDSGRPESTFPPPRQGAQAGLRQTWFS
jgi:hypothetical protein